MTVLVLGDCASAGTNCLNPEIIDKNIIKFSLRYDDEYWFELFLWYLENNKEQRTKIVKSPSLQRWKTKSELTRVFKQEYQRWGKSASFAYLYEREIQASYFQYFPYEVVNLSKNGATAQGYYMRLKKFELHNGRPTTILLTDHGINHCAHYMNWQGKKYFLEYGRHGNFKCNTKYTLPCDLQLKIHNRTQEFRRKNLLQIRANRSMTWFVNYLNKHNYNYKLITFYENFDAFSKNAINCRDLNKLYYSEVGDDCNKKIELQSQIADRILSHLT